MNQSCRKQQKDVVTKEKHNKRKSQSKELEKSKMEQAQQKETISQHAYETWKSIKDKDIKTNKTLYTYKDQKKVQARAWRPARSMQYSYPQSKENKLSERAGSRGQVSRSASELQSPNTMDSYSNASFESSEFEEDIGRKSESSTESSSSRSPVSTIALTGTHKTIQVCCQTLPYWCTCKDTH